MARKLITVDIDDVVADSTEAFRIAVNRHTGASLTPADYKVPHTGYNRYYEHVWKSHGLNIIYDEVSLPMQANQAQVKLVRGAKKALLELAQSYEIAFITSRPISWADATHVYINLKFKGLDSKVHFTEKREGISKGQICKELGASCHIDDNPDHCESVLEEGVSAILFGDYGWHYRPLKDAIYCKNWNDVLEYFRGQK